MLCHNIVFSPFHQYVTWSFVWYVRHDPSNHRLLKLLHFHRQPALRARLRRLPGLWVDHRIPKYVLVFWGITLLYPRARHSALPKICFGLCQLVSGEEQIEAGRNKGMLRTSQLLLELCLLPLFLLSLSSLKFGVKILGAAPFFKSIFFYLSLH